MNSRNGCLIVIGLGFGAGAGYLFVRWLERSEAARLLTMGTVMFILGTIIVGLWTVYTARSVAQAMGSRPRHEGTNYQVLPPAGPPALPPGVPWGPARREWEMLPPGETWPALPGAADGKDEFVG